MLTVLSITNQIISEIISDNFFDYDMFLNLHELKYLDISNCRGITDKDLFFICKLPKLEVLKMNKIDTVFGAGLGVAYNLKELHCFGCEKLINDSLLRLMLVASNLEYLDIRRCLKITNLTINAAIEIKKTRKNNIILEIKMLRHFQGEINLFPLFKQPGFNSFVGNFPLLHLIIVD